MPQTDINHADIRTRFIFDDMPVRGLHVRLENVWKHIAEQKHYPAAIRRALGELLAAGALLSSNLKNEGTLIVQVQGQGRLKRCRSFKNEAARNLTEKRFRAVCACLASRSG